VNVLSLFDGMSCGRIALERAGVQVDSYYASEVDARAIQVTQANYPDTVQLGDVEAVESLSGIDLLLGGSPCQSFSPAISSNTGFDGKSKLFFEYVRLLEVCQPGHFLLENVVMKKEWAQIITDRVGVEPVEINSNRFSAQARPRLYWTNIPIPELPPESDLVLGDILEDKVDEKYYYSEPFDLHGHSKVVCATLHINGHDILKRVNSPRYKCQTLTAVCGGNQQKKVLQNGRVRKLTPVEYERLQTVPDGYSACVSDSARYKMLGNGWTVDVIAYILKGLR
jgi:DNA-cytosine methyltransferase